MVRRVPINERIVKTKRKKRGRKLILIFLVTVFFN